MSICLQTLASCYLSGSKTFLQYKPETESIYFESKICANIFQKKKLLLWRQMVSISSLCLGFYCSESCWQVFADKSACSMWTTSASEQYNHEDVFAKKFFPSYPCDWGFHDHWNGDCRQPPATAYQPVGECIFFLHWLPDSHCVTGGLVTWNYQYGGQVNVTWLAVMWLQNPQ